MSRHEAILPVVQSNFTCNRSGDCCRIHRVPVTIADLRRIKTPLSSQDKNNYAAAGDALTLQDYLELVDASELDIIGEPESLFWLPKGKKLLVLAQRQQLGSPSCFFLHETEQPGSDCSIHQTKCIAIHKHRAVATLQPIAKAAGSS